MSVLRRIADLPQTSRQFGEVPNGDVEPRDAVASTEERPRTVSRRSAEMKLPVWASQGILRKRHLDLWWSRLEADMQNHAAQDNDRFGELRKAVSITRRTTKKTDEKVARILGILEGQQRERKRRPSHLLPPDSEETAPEPGASDRR